MATWPLVPLTWTSHAAKPDPDWWDTYGFYVLIGGILLFALVGAGITQVAICLARREEERNAVRNLDIEKGQGGHQQRDVPARTIDTENGQGGYQQREFV